MPDDLGTALRWIMDLLDEVGAPRQLVGGLAARVHGASRELVDVDLYVPDAVLPQVATAAGRHLVQAPTHHVDEHWDITFMKLEHSGWTIELGGADSARVRDRRVGTWRPAAIDFDDATVRSVAGVELPVIRLERLLEYKRGLDRPVDRADVADLEPAPARTRPAPPLPTLSTRRLELRTLGTTDVDALYDLFGDPELTRFWGHPALPDRAAAEELLEQIQDGARTGSLLQWGISCRGGREIVGTCTLADIDRRHRRAELGVALHAGHRGRGHAEEAAGAALRHGFEELHLHRVTADVDPRNEPALRLVQRLGFEREGRLREHYRGDDGWQDGILFALLRRHWRAAVEPAARGAD